MFDSKYLAFTLWDRNWNYYSISMNIKVIFCLQLYTPTSIYFSLDQVILSGTPFEEVKQPVGLPLWQRERKEEKKERIKKGKRKRERNRKKK